MDKPNKIPEERKYTYQRYYRPLGENVMVQPVLEDITPQTTEAGIELQGESTLASVIKAVVKAKGLGTPDHDMKVKYGDIVLVGRGDGTPIQFGKAQMFILPESQIFAIL